MRIRKQYQVIPTNAKLENGDSTSETNGYTAEYINDHSVVVSATEPSGSARKKVWLQHDNIFDNTAQQTFTNATTLTAIPTGIRATLGVATTSAMACIDIGAITDFVGKTIYIKFKCYSSTSKGRIYLGKSNVGQTSRQMIVNSGEIDNGEYVISTKITADDTTYPRLFLAIYSNGDDANSHPIGTYVDYTNLIVTTVEDKEYILNNNVYEEFEPQNEIYSESEIKIGTYLGKPLYRKTFVIPKNSISTTADADEYRYNISDNISYDKIFIDQSHSAYILSSGNMFQNETKPSNPNYSVSFRGVNPQSKFIQLFIGSSIYSSLDTVHITIEYTKTTD